MKTLKPVFRFMLLMILSMLFSYCSKDTPEQEALVMESADLTTFFSTLPQWETFSPPLAAEDKKTGESIPDEERTDIEGNPYSCSSTSYSMTNTPDKITTLNPDVEVLYVGSLLQGDGHLNGIGSLAELPVRQRAPLEITLDLLSSNNNRYVENPTVSTVNQAIGTLISDAQDAGHQSGSNIFYTSETTHSLEQASLQMGLSASYMGASIKTSLSTNLSEEKRSVTAFFVQQMFTASMVLPQYPEDVFSDEFTQELLDRERDSGRMSAENLPVYVSSIVYGRIMMFSFTSTSTELKIKSTLNAMYNGGEFGGELDTELQAVLDEAEISVTTVGGNADHALGLIRENNLAAFFTSDAPLTSARPISYTVRNLKDNVIARVSETTDYNLRECTESEPTGAEYTIQLTRLEPLALPNIDPIGTNAEIYYDFKLEGLAGPEIAAHINPLWWLITIKEGTSFDLIHHEESGLRLLKPLPVFVDVPLHKDGRDYIRVHGSLWENDVVGDDEFPFFREFRGPDKLLPMEDNEKRQFSLDSQDSHGNKFRLFGTYQRTKLLFD